MSKLFVFGIGGTGARVLKALTMLLASGVKMKNFEEVVPLFVDPDQENGDLTHTSLLMKNYLSIRETAFKNVAPNDSSPSFFYTKITSINNKDDDFRMDLPGISDKKFQDFIKNEFLDSSTTKLTKLLFSDDNLSSSMSVGFLGQPNIGSVVLNSLMETSLSKVYSKYNEGDRIFIINSIFGGTGAAGFPVLIKNLRKDYANSDEKVKKSIIGGVTILPYFTVDKDSGEKEECPIDSDSFIPKTKAALSYYKKNVKELDALYYLGDDSSDNRNSYKASKGGKDQKNLAHFIEFAAATAIIDFAQKDNNVFRDQNNNKKDTIVKEFGCREPEALKPVDFGHFGDTLDNVKYPLASFYLLSRFFSCSLSESLNSENAWVKQCGISSNYENDEWMKNISNFMKEYFNWLSEMEKNFISFKPFLLENHDKKNCACDLFNTEQIKNKLKAPLSKKGYSLIRYRMNKNAKNLSSANNKERLVLSLFSDVFFSIVEEQYKKPLNWR